MSCGHLSDHFTTVGTTTVRAGPGTLHALVLNAPGSNNSRVVLRDDTRVLADVVTGGGSVMVGEIVYDVFFHVNLTVVRSGGTAPRITVSYK